jgi:tRNA (cmo5U34)-methyltransferase
MQLQSVKAIKTRKQNFSVLDLGIGTGKTTGLILKKFPSAKITGVDISKKMFSSAKKRLGKKHMQVLFIQEDIAKYNPKENYDLVIGVLAIHHLFKKDKKKVYKKIYGSLNKYGLFIIGDLIIGNTKKETIALETNWKKYLHKKFGVKTGNKWFKIYKEEDLPESIADHINWLKNAGFKEAKCVWNKDNLAVIVGKK